MAIGTGRLRPAALLLSMGGLGAPASAQDAADTVAEAVRERGLPCARPVAAERDGAASGPDEAVWILTCGDGRYRVRFPGDTAPQVERLEP